MADKSWISRFNPLKSLQNRETELKQKLDHVIGEMNDISDYDVKTLDSEAQGSYGNGIVELQGIDQVVNNLMLQRLYTTETWVYAAVNAIAKTISGLPVILEKKRTSKQKVTDPFTQVEHEIEKIHWDPAMGAEFMKLFTRPNAYSSKTELMMLLMIDLLTTGNYYLYLDSDVDLSAIKPLQGTENSPFARIQQLMDLDIKVKAMYRIPPTTIKIIPKEDGTGIAGYICQTETGMYAFDAAEMIHVKLPNPLNQYEGLSPLLAALKPVLLDRYATEHMIRFYKSGARLGGVIETQKSLGKEQLARFQRSFENNYTGRQNHHRTLILPPGMEYKSIEQNPADSALLEFAKYNRDSILAVYNVPPIKVGVLDNANYANALVQLKIFFTDTIKPYLAFIEDGFNSKPTFIPAFSGYRMRFDLSDVEALKEDQKAKADAAKSMLDSGMTVNEVRQEVWHLPLLPDGNNSPVVVNMKQQQLGNFQSVTEPKPNADTAPADTDSASEAQENIAQNQITDPALSLNGAQVSAMLDILNRVAQGLLPRDTGIETLVVAFSIPRDAAQRIMSTVGTTFSITPQQVEGAQKPKDPTDPATEPVEPASPEGNDQRKADQGEQHDSVAVASDINPTKMSFVDRVNQLVGEFTQSGIPQHIAVPKAIAQALMEGLSPEDPNPPGGGQPLADKVQGDLEKLGDTPVTSEMIQQVLAHDDAPVTTNEAVVAHPLVRFGMNKNQVVEHWKSFISKTEPMIDTRLAVVQKFFKDYEDLIQKRTKSKLKSLQLPTSKRKDANGDDIDDITDEAALKSLIDSYIKEIDKTLLDAVKYGFEGTLTTFKFDPPDAKASEFLKKYAAERVKGIVDTTKEQLRNVLSEAFEAGVSVTETQQRIAEKFAEISVGRAAVIARQETLTAVSEGREMKRAEWTQQFPDKKLKKAWVSAQDDKVRDTHADLDGTVVDVDAEFKDGLRFPRDPNCEDLSEIIGCRCTDITFTEDQEEQIKDTLGEEKSLKTDTKE